MSPRINWGAGAGAPSAETEDFIKSYREARRKAAQYGHELCYSAARLGILTNHFCGISADSFALSSDGNVSAYYEAFSEENTWASTFFYGRPDAKHGYTFALVVRVA